MPRRSMFGGGARSRRSRARMAIASFPADARRWAPSAPRARRIPSGARGSGRSSSGRLGARPSTPPRRPCSPTSRSRNRAGRMRESTCCRRCAWTRRRRGSTSASPWRRWRPARWRKPSVSCRRTAAPILAIPPSKGWKPACATPIPRTGGDERAQGPAGTAGVRARREPGEPAARASGVDRDCARGRGLRARVGDLPDLRDGLLAASGGGARDLDASCRAHDADLDVAHVRRAGCQQLLGFRGAAVADLAVRRDAGAVPLALGHDAGGIRTGVRNVAPHGGPRLHPAGRDGRLRAHLPPALAGPARDPGFSVAGSESLAARDPPEPRHEDGSCQGRHAHGVEPGSRSRPAALALGKHTPLVSPGLRGARRPWPRGPARAVAEEGTGYGRCRAALVDRARRPGDAVRESLRLADRGTAIRVLLGPASRGDLPVRARAAAPRLEARPSKSPSAGPRGLAPAGGLALAA